MLAESPKDQETAIAEKKDTCRAHYAFSAIGEHLFRGDGGPRHSDFRQLNIENWRKSLLTFLSLSKAREFLRNITTVPRLLNKTGFAAIRGVLIFKYGFGLI